MEFTLVNNFFLHLSIADKDIVVITLDTRLPTLQSPSSRLVPWCRIEPFVVFFFFTRLYVNSVIDNLFSLYIHNQFEQFVERPRKRTFLEGL